MRGHKGDTLADDREQRTNQRHLHDEQHSLHAEIGLQLKDLLWTVPNLEEDQPFSVTPVTGCHSSQLIPQLQVSSECGSIALCVNKLRSDVRIPHNVVGMAWLLADLAACGPATMALPSIISRSIGDGLRSR